MKHLLVGALIWAGCFCLVICNPLVPWCRIARASLSWADDALIVANFHLKAMVSPRASSCSPITWSPLITGSSCRWCLTWWPNVVSKSSTHASGPHWGLWWLTRYCLSKSKWIFLNRLSGPNDIRVENWLEMKMIMDAFIISELYQVWECRN